MANPLKEHLMAVKKAMTELHRQFLEDLRLEREDDTKKKMTSVEWLHALIGSEEYKWIAPFNSLMTDVDALSDREPTESDLLIVRAELEKLFFQDDPSDGFAGQFYAMTQQNADLIYFHTALRTSIRMLPVGAPSPQSAQIRLGWHQSERLAKLLKK